MGMPAFVIAPGIAPARFAISRECSLHSMARSTFENPSLRSFPVIPFLSVLRKVQPLIFILRRNTESNQFVHDE